ncbi:MAG: FAD-binding oxidoreductase [Actinomycetota bacterium]
MSPLDDLAEAVGDEHVLHTADVRRGHEVDWTGRYGAPSVAVVRPASAIEVQAVLAACRDHDLAVVPQGGNTGLVGGGVPRDDGRRWVVLSTRRLCDIGPVDGASAQVTCGAGATIAAWRDAARAADLDIPIDFAARDSATVGGAISTNAGGSRVVRFGTMRSQVVGIEAVLGDGTLVGSLSGLTKETAGLHWPSVLSGSEGTAGVVTSARLRLVPRYRETATALVLYESLALARDALVAARAEVPSLDAAELILPSAYRLVVDHFGGRGPLGAMASPTDRSADEPADPRAVVLFEAADHADPTDELAELLDATDGVADAAIGTGAERRRTLVDVRDRMTEAIAAESTRLGVPTFKLDVAVPLDELEELVDVARTAARIDGARLIPFGHLAEGNVHLNFLGASGTDAIADRVLGHVAHRGGTISAEHGIGVAKADYLPLIRTGDELAAQRRLVGSLDPDGLLNPGVLFAD